jgi:hypothetical protein
MITSDFAVSQRRGRLCKQRGELLISGGLSAKPEHPFSSFRRSGDDALTPARHPTLSMNCSECSRPARVVAKTCSLECADVRNRRIQAEYRNKIWGARRETRAIMAASLCLGGDRCACGACVSQRRSTVAWLRQSRRNQVDPISIMRLLCKLQLVGRHCTRRSRVRDSEWVRVDLYGPQFRSSWDVMRDRALI